MTTSNPERPATLPDSAERERAATTFDRNIVVTAGAGTGKTTLLVDRLVHLLMRDPDPLPITRIVALTFTNKAASEMRVRLHERLQGYLLSRLDTQPNGPGQNRTDAEIRGLIRRYRLSKAELDRRAHDALRHLEPSYIGTLHSFAALLLRLYPAETGVDPHFEEDDGVRFRSHFEEQWTLWLDWELGRQGGRHEVWSRILEKLSLETLGEVAFSLCSEMIPLEQLASDGELQPALRSWLAHQEHQARELLKRYPEERNQIDRWLRYVHATLRSALKTGGLLPGELLEARNWFADKTLQVAGKWSEADFFTFQELARVGRGLLGTDSELTGHLWQLLIPFADACRKSFIQRGYVSFDGLLTRARNLLRDHPRLREEVKALFKAVLVDEFQDTDPLQYEIVLYLAERSGKSAADWQAVQLQPGKVFVVGDPKQSIYAFRRADIQGYLDVVRRIILAQGGIECPLTTNFRSRSQILDAVNGVFAPLIRERAGLQPEYVPIQSPENAEPGTAPVSSRSALPRVVLRKIESEQKLNAASARRLEADSLARWLQEEVFGKLQIRSRDGETWPARPGDVAFLFRKLTDVHLYLEPLRRRGIPYVVEGEKHFYATQEIVDAVNLLRAVDNPYDQSALAGLLRSPIGGLSDLQIHRLRSAGWLNYLSIAGAGGLPPNDLEPAWNLYNTLNRLHMEIRTLSVADAVKHIFDSIPIRLLAARSFNGEQAVANLEKIRQQAALMGREGLSTLKDIVRRLQRRVLEVEEESESALAEESVDAVKILSIHKAKGLEFPMVVIPDGGGAANPGRAVNGIQYDWASKLLGLRAAEHLNVAAIFLDQMKRRREAEEQKRVFYVAMTRAREHLIISCPPLNVGKGSFVAMLEQSIGPVRSIPSSQPLAVGAGTLHVEVIQERQNPPRRAQPPAQGAVADRTDWSGFAARWSARGRCYEQARRNALFVSPSSLKENQPEMAERSESQASLFAPLDPLLVGTLAHGFLEQLDFSAQPARLQSELARYVEEQPENRVGSSRAAMLRELGEIFGSFLGSAAFNEISSAHILGREIPLLMPWDDCVMEGVIDLIYERGGRLYLADYKTDRVGRQEMCRAAERYRGQARIYRQAAARALERPVAAFKVIFLRRGEAVEIDCA